MEHPNDNAVSVSTMPQNTSLPPLSSLLSLSSLPKPPVRLPGTSSPNLIPHVYGSAGLASSTSSSSPQHQQNQQNQQTNTNNPYSPSSRESSRWRSNSPPESCSSRPTTAVTAPDLTTTTLPPIRDIVSQPHKITLPPMRSQMPNAIAPGPDGGHYVFGTSPGSAVLSSPLCPPATFVPPSQRLAAPSPVAFSSGSHSGPAFQAVAGAGGAAYEAPRSPSFVLNDGNSLPSPLALAAAAPATAAPTYTPRSPPSEIPPPTMGKRRASPPSSMGFNAMDQPHPAQARVKPMIPTYSNNAPAAPSLQPRSGNAVMSPIPRSPGWNSASGSGVSDGVAEDNNGLKDGPQHQSAAADPRMSVGNPLPWAHMVSAMTEEQQEQEDVEAAQQAEGSIAVDSDEMATDAGYESDNVSTGSTSLASTVRDYAFENGRRYHKFREGRYNFPNDDVEQEREDMKHAMAKMLCQHLHFAPIGDHPQNILDIGTGTGIWAIEMGDQFSSANVLGIDLSPIQPDWVPPNVRFMVDDVESAWLHPRNHFDYIHSRHTVMAMKDWPRLFRRSLEHLKPGGWMELQEIHHFPYSADNSMQASHPVGQYWNLIREGLNTLGIDFHAVADGKLANMMRDCGYVNVTERVFHVPIGVWPKNKVLKTVGLYWRTILLDGIQAIALGPLMRGCKWSREQVEVFLVNVRRAYHDNSCHMYMPLHIIYGQKAESDGPWY